MASFFGEDLSQRCRFEGPHPLSGATLAKKGRIQGESTGRDIASEQCPSLNAWASEIREKFQIWNWRHGWRARAGCPPPSVYNLSSLLCVCEWFPKRGQPQAGIAQVGGAGNRQTDTAFYLARARVSRDKKTTPARTLRHLFRCCDLVRRREKHGREGTVRTTEGRPSVDEFTTFLTWFAHQNWLWDVLSEQCGLTTELPSWKMALVWSDGHTVFLFGHGHA